jgi:hypothetical protein
MPRGDLPAQASRYLSFLLRCWEDHAQAPNQPVIWRFSLEDVTTGERRGFRDLEALVVFLHTQTSDSQPDTETDAPLNF